ncbi:MAG TPA: hypothetical protein PLV92_23405, partial [Pirellulaceae bacterium]|nr:hypothetical protein [Pirellulaceae bacterium]
DMTIQRDGLAARGLVATVLEGGGNYTLSLSGPDALQSAMQGYATRLPQFLANGWNALTQTVPQIKAAGAWDPSPDPAPYHPWRFFLPHGMAMLNQRALLFFHYPPIRLLDTNQDYLDDPVPVRCSELLAANGVAPGDIPLFNTVMDATPIGADDSQGSKKAGDPTWGLIPIQYFHDYQRAQVQLLLNNSTHTDFTVPIVVYGAHPLATFNELYGTELKTNHVVTHEIVPGKQTPVMATTHPYVFYGKAQGFDAIGSGKIVSESAATSQMIADLIVARWLMQMSIDPTQDPTSVLAEARDFWHDPEQASMVQALVAHQGSLFYSDPTTLSFKFNTPLPPGFPGA